VNVTGAATMEFVNSGQAEYERRKKDPIRIAENLTNAYFVTLC
jgi:hypothetical protein